MHARADSGVNVVMGGRCGWMDDTERDDDSTEVNRAGEVLLALVSSSKMR
jgi:hypothetical protein